VYMANFKMAIYLCREFLKNHPYDGDELMRTIGRYIEPVRPGRADARKLRPKGFAGFVYRVAA